MSPRLTARLPSEAVRKDYAERAYRLARADRARRGRRLRSAFSARAGRHGFPGPPCHDVQRQGPVSGHRRRGAPARRQAATCPGRRAARRPADHSHVHLRRPTSWCDTSSNMAWCSVKRSRMPSSSLRGRPRTRRVKPHAEVVVGSLHPDPHRAVRRCAISGRRCPSISDSLARVGSSDTSLMRQRR